MNETLLLLHEHDKAVLSTNSTALSTAAKSVAMKTMEDVANELHHDNCNPISVVFW